MFDTIFGFVFVLIGGIVLFTVSNTMNTTVVERTVEIGTLRAIGLRRAGIRRLFVTEGALLGVCGAVLGLVLALLLAASSTSRHALVATGQCRARALPVNVWGETRMIVGTTLGLICIAIVCLVASLPCGPAERGGGLAPCLKKADEIDLRFLAASLGFGCIAAPSAAKYWRPVTPFATPAVHSASP